MLAPLISGMENQSSVGLRAQRHHQAGRKDKVEMKKQEEHISPGRVAWGSKTGTAGRMEICQLGTELQQGKKSKERAKQREKWAQETQLSSGQGWEHCLTQQGSQGRQCLPETRFWL